MKNFLKAWAVSLLVDLVLIGLLEWGEVEEPTKGVLIVLFFSMGTVASMTYATCLHDQMLEDKIRGWWQ